MNMNRLLVFAGAGISAESGIDTFRDSGGLWERYDVNTIANYAAFKLATKENTQLRKDIFAFYNSRKENIKLAQPNDAHYACAEWQKKYGAVIITSNIDDLFEKAGCVDVMHVHGDMNEMGCDSCKHTWPAEVFEDVRCPKCNSRYTKPNVVFFGEGAPLYSSMNYLYHRKRRNIDDTLVYIGSSQQVNPPSRLFQECYIGNKILCNKDICFQDNVFDHKVYGLASVEVPKLESLF
jgi:NAD-dependent deacetylase